MRVLERLSSKISTFFGTGLSPRNFKANETRCSHDQIKKSCWFIYVKCIGNKNKAVLDSIIECQRFPCGGFHILVIWSLAIYNEMSFNDNNRLLNWTLQVKGDRRQLWAWKKWNKRGIRSERNSFESRTTNLNNISL